MRRCIIEIICGPASAPSVRRPRLSAYLQARIELEFAARLRDEWGGKSITQAGVPESTSVRLDANDYLSITGHPLIVRAQLDSIRSDRELVLQAGGFRLEGKYRVADRAGAE